jgi:signal transduction histidine kinase
MYPYIERSGNVVGTSFWEEIRGERKYLSVIAARIYDNYGQVAGVIESIRDITSHKMAEEALLMANKKLNLLSSVTRHDINNKIMICQGHLYLLEEAGLSSEDLESLSAIKRSLGEIEHFISFTKTYQELGLKVPVWHNVGETFNRMGKDIQTGDIIVNNSISGIYILADPLFEKVCYNLLENAVRHGDQLTRINISAEESDLGLKIFVEDDGPGILEEVKEMIFNRGYGKNTGFGLFLAREILSLSEITIFERGEYGAGCRFEIDVPKGKYRKDE